MDEDSARLARLLGEEALQALLEIGGGGEVGGAVAVVAGDHARLVLQADPQHVVVGRAEEGLVDPIVELEGGAEEYVALRLVDHGDEGVEVLLVGARREPRNERLVLRQRVVAVDPVAGRAHVGTAEEELEEIQVSARDLGALRDVDYVRLQVDAASGPVRRAAQHRDGIALARPHAAENRELVVEDARGKARPQPLRGPAGEVLLVLGGLRVALLGMKDDPHVGPAVERALDLIEDRRQLILVDRDVEGPGGVGRAGDERGDLLEQAARQPCESIGRQLLRLALLLRLLELRVDVRELAREGLARGRGAVEDHPMLAAADALSPHLDGRTVLDLGRVGLPANPPMSSPTNE